MGANKQTKPARRQTREKVAQMRAERARQERRRTLLVAGVTALVVVLILGAAIWAVVQARQGATVASVPGVQTINVPSTQHVQGPVKYPQTPPVGGDHAPIWLNCGFYGKPVASENAVHDLEHGAVWITYQPTLPQAQVDQLRQLATGQTFVTVSPFDGLPSPVVASAWGKQLQLTGADDPKLQDFVKAYRLGPQNPEPGATCTGGTGQPG